jgi:hypothetical protein
MLSYTAVHADPPCCCCCCCCCCCLCRTSQASPLFMPLACPPSYAQPLVATLGPSPTHRPLLQLQKRPAHRQQYLISQPAHHQLPLTTVIRRIKTAAVLLLPPTPSPPRHPLQHLMLLLLAPRLHHSHVAGHCCLACQFLTVIQCQAVCSA